MEANGKYQTNRKRMTMLVGPWGGSGGDSWDDGGTYDGIRSIYVAHGLCIDSICAVYDYNGKPVTANKHGGTGGKIDEIKLDYPDEFLVGVSGYYGNFWFMYVIRSITFESNRRTYGPFGDEVGTPFTFTVESGSVVGFKGRSGWYIDSIGFYISNTPPPSLSPPLPPPSSPPPPPPAPTTTPRHRRTFQQKLRRLVSCHN
ncbi:hypothetical protein K2173_024548 [Erythroxylum novogranatense]|uniref:Jacalin-type lectin domain-containing protein n=1 Tax=Erythroxylum novogranatense TaxID=1862640 RepID=A0AAV8SVP9_9ROSI|nr:hypothetical protein K2173_024548 [Erythroxylum novogranatense]